MNIKLHWNKFCYYFFDNLLWELDSLLDLIDKVFKSEIPIRKKIVKRRYKHYTKWMEEEKFL